MDERNKKESDGRSPAAEGGADAPSGEHGPAQQAPSRPRSRRGTRGGQRRRGAKAAADGAEAPRAAGDAAPAGQPPLADAAQTEPAPAPARGDTPAGGGSIAPGQQKGRAPRRTKVAAPAASGTTAAVQADAESAADTSANKPPTDKPTRRSRRRRRSSGDAPAAGGPPAGPAPAGTAPLAEAQGTPEPAPSRRSRRAKAEVTDNQTPRATESAAALEQPEDGGESDAAGESADDGEAARKRRRGARGGRRVRAREARRAAVLAATEAPDVVPRESTTAAGGAASAVDAPDEGSAEAGGTLDVPADEAAAPVPKRRGRRGGRRQAVATSDDESAAADEVAPSAAATKAEASAGQPEPGETAKKQTRRGGRRGKRLAAGDEAPGAAVAIEPAVAGEAAGPAAAEEDKAASKGRQRDRRRPKAIVRPESLTGADADAIAGPALTTGRRPEVTVEPPKRKLILVTEDPSELRVALVEDGRLAEIYFERPEKRSYLGDIYRGKVENVLAGIDAAFVDFGLDKNGFLYVDEVRTGEGDRRGRRISDVLKPGQDVVVQVMKDPMGSKGARLTMHLSLAGRYVVYVPGGSGVGVSRRLGQGERERLRELCKELRVKNAGLIVRTAAEGEGLEELRRDVRFLSRLWSRLKKKAETAPIPGLVHKEVDIALEVTRDLFNESVESLIVDDQKRHKAIVDFLEKVAPELVPRIRLHTGAEPLFEAYGIEQQISRALERRVPLPSGGNIVIDHAEALTVIDVNSGRYTSGRGLEDTILKTNLEAAREVVRQLRLRDIGGIIIIDFIDMSRVKNRETVLATLEGELDTDRTKTYVVELSPLGLVEMTRQNTTDGARGILTRTCTCCQGKARTLSEETVALGVERRLRVQSRRSGAKACLLEVNAGVAERLTAGGRLKALEKETGRRIFLEGSSSVAVDAFRILAEGSAEQVKGQRIPVSEGQEVEVELEFTLTYSPRDAVGYVDGYMVIVEGGRNFLGERRKVRIDGTSRTGASAVLTGGRGGGGG